MSTQKFPVRQEYKYFVPRHLYPHLLKDLAVFTQADSHTQQQGFYEVASVYFETRQLKSYFDKIDGQYERVKLRVRFYPNASKGQLNIEFKHKKGDQCLKRKTFVEYKWLPNLLDPDFSDITHFRENKVAEDFLKIKKANHFRPFVRVDYKRKAFFSKNDKNIRITFDYDVKCARALRDLPKMPHIPVLPHKALIIEIKTPGHFPFWLTHIIKKYGLKKAAISKYALAVQKLALNSTLTLH